ncbi:hypothetical protein BO94DRAFT_540499 [Aspergillus sclerotioniger CBS 115572]|uniref:TLDc domain-containing protein n=1 Tax=Aspergillus sclerotioniger CBS 115572 TaxID=1450535 RepID=A0A317V090_9EURO|nr:hypothetical protein BO94DRAFT_540499 [Aspergillus sclerotioniger CBS 115572]PWY67069.1 hypothetical protein BO94DRAFT_540499 [Aspergillus sclerotioniger CBS 115572]
MNNAPDQRHPDTVLSDLHACLVREVTTSVAPQAVFSASSIRDSPQKQPYWTKKSFQNHLARTHPDTNIPDTAINVLWSCFCFYAYHPFPLPDASERKLELPAFEQGLILLSFQGTRLLGTVNDDGHGHSWGWSNEPCNCMLRINRIFRGISLIDDQSSSDPHGASYDTLITDDVMQALLPIFPAHPKLFPSLNQLKPLAEHLKGRTDQYQIKLNDLASLVCLIIRLRVHKSTWGRELHYGYFGENSPETEELATILARSFCHGHDEYLAPDSVLRALHILPNLEQCFHQLWAVIFQPCTPTQIPNLESESTPDITLDGILRAVSLFVPPFQAHERTELGRKVNLITFQKQHDWIHSFSDTLDLSHILHQAFLDDPNRRAQLVLFLGHQAQDSKKVVVGAFFPGRTQTPAAEEGKQLEEVENSRISLPQLLFQLQPSFSLFRWNGEANMSSSQLYDSAIGDVDHPNCIGDPKGSKVGVEIDSATRQATFLGGTDTAICQTGGYDEVTRKYNGAEGINANQKERKTKFTVTRIVVFDVEGGPNYDYHWGFGQD